MTGELAERALGIAFQNRPPGTTPVHYDMRTIHAELFGGKGPYTYSHETTLNELTTFVNAERERK